MTTIKEIIQSKETKCFKFCPDKSFYEAVNINQKRWGLIYRGKLEPTISKVKAIANYFEIPITDFF